MQNNLKTIFFICFAFFSSLKCLAQFQLYVSPHGTGTNCSQDKPCSILDAKQLVRDSIKMGFDGDIEVILMKGDYWISETLLFNEHDNSASGSVVWRAMDGHERKVFFNGGKLIPNNQWELFDAARNIWRTKVSSHSFRHVWIHNNSGKSAECRIARYPNKGERFQALGYHKPNDLRYLKFSRDLNYAFVKTAKEVFVQHKWQSHILPVKKLDTLEQAYLIIYDSPAAELFLNLETNVQRDTQSTFYFQNSLQFIDLANEWCISGEYLYFKPDGDEPVNIVIPALNTILHVANVQNLTFQGIVFQYTKWISPSNNGFISTWGGGFFKTKISNKGTVIPSSVNIISSKNVKFTNNVFRRMGKGALNLANGNEGTIIHGNLFYDIAATGISVFDKIENYQNFEIDKNTRITSNYFLRCGNTYTSSSAINVTYSEDILIAMNEITQMPYNGIRLGIGFCNPDNPNKNNTVKNNYIHEVMLRHTDGGGIYTQGIQAGSHISGNLIENLYRSNYAENCNEAPGGGNGGIYLDVFSGGAINAKEENQKLIIKDNFINYDSSYCEIWSCKKMCQERNILYQNNHLPFAIKQHGARHYDIAYENNYHKNSNSTQLQTKLAKSLCYNYNRKYLKKNIIANTSTGTLETVGGIARNVPIQFVLLTEQRDIQPTFKINSVSWQKEFEDFQSNYQTPGPGDIILE